MSIEEIKEILYRAYRIDENYDDEEKGCFINDKWLSIGNILRYIERGY